MTTPHDLAARIERADGPDRALDAEIALAAGYRTWPDGYGEGSEWEDPKGNRLPRVRGFGAQPPHFTGSLDAAMQLVPEGWNWLVRKDVGERTAFANVSAQNANNVCDTWNAETAALVGDGFGHNYARGATPAQALCAAALRARGQS